MKITWFSGTTLRVQIGGEIVVVDADRAASGLDRSELASGADRVLPFSGAGLPLFDLSQWKPRPPVRLLDRVETPQPVLFWRIQSNGLVIEAPDEAPLIIVDADHGQPWGRWADGAVIVLCGMAVVCGLQGRAVLEAARPRLLALACNEIGLDAAFEVLRPHLDGSALQVLEPGLAVEV